MAPRLIDQTSPLKRLGPLTVRPRLPRADRIRRVVLQIGLALMIWPTGSATSGALPPAQFELPDVYRELWPADDGTETRLLNDLGPDYQVFRGDHFLIAHSHVSLTVPYRAAIIESVYASFVHFFTLRGFELTRPTSLQTVILLPTHAEFLAHAGVPDLPENVDGLYRYEENRAYFFDALGRVEIRESDKANRENEFELKKLRRKIARSRDNSEWTLKRKGSPGRRYSKRHALTEIDRQLRLHNRDSRRLRSSVGQRSVETMCHEIAHQLAQVMGVFARHGQSPRWVTEGLATFFEPSKDGYLLGHAATHWARWDALQKSHRAGERIALRDLLTRDELLVDPSAASLAYNESWSLVHYLVVQRGDGFIRYLRSLKSPSVSTSAARRLEAFEDAFGEELAQIESDWSTHVIGLGTPKAELAIDPKAKTQATAIPTKSPSAGASVLKTGAPRPRE